MFISCTRGTLSALNTWFQCAPDCEEWTCTHKHTVYKHTNTNAELHYGKPTQLWKEWFTCWSSKVSPHFNASLISLPLCIATSQSVCHVWCLSLFLCLTIYPIFFFLLCLLRATLSVIAFCTLVGLLLIRQQTDDINNVSSDCLFRREVMIQLISLFSFSVCFSFSPVSVASS